MLKQATKFFSLNEAKISLLSCQSKYPHHKNIVCTTNSSSFSVVALSALGNSPSAAIYHPGNQCVTADASGTKAAARRMSCCVQHLYLSVAALANTPSHSFSSCFSGKLEIGLILFVFSPGLAGGIEERQFPHSSGESGRCAARREARGVAEQERGHRYDYPQVSIQKKKKKKEMWVRSPLSWKINGFDLIKPAEASPLTN